MATSWQAIHKIADTLSPHMEKAFLAAVRKLQGTVDLTALARALSSGNLSAAQLVIDTARFPKDLIPAVQVVNQAFAAAGKVAASQIGAVLNFTLTNPRAVAWARTNGATLVRQVTEETKQAIRSIVSRAIRTGIAPVEAARSIRQIVGLTERDANAVITYRFKLLEQGLPGERVHTLAERYSTKLLNRRGRLIARQETMKASNEGQLELWRQARDRGFIDDTMERVFVVTPDDRLCPICRPMNGKRAPIDGQFPGGYAGPPIHVACRCSQGLARVTAARAA
jgi:SPP1 gp7 family putative phage head morphogenesis protein